MCVLPPQEANPLGSSSLILTLIPIELLRCQQQPPNPHPDKRSCFSCFVNGCQTRCETGFNTTLQEANMKKKATEGANTRVLIFRRFITAADQSCGGTAKTHLWGQKVKFEVDLTGHHAAPRSSQCAFVLNSGGIMFSPASPFPVPVLLG